MHWAAAFLGKPFRPGGIGPDAYDCWGLLRAVYRERLRVDLPQSSVLPLANHASLRALIEEFRGGMLHSGWQEVAEPRDLDAVLMAQSRHPAHVGLWLADRGAVLHAMRGGVTVMDKRALALAGFRVRGYYRHDAAAG